MNQTLPTTTNNNFFYPESQAVQRQNGRTACILCKKYVASITDHLKEKHPEFFYAQLNPLIQGQTPSNFPMLPPPPVFQSQPIENMPRQQSQLNMPRQQLQSLVQNPVERPEQPLQQRGREQNVQLNNPSFSVMTLILLTLGSVLFAGMLVLLGEYKTGFFRKVLATHGYTTAQEGTKRHLYTSSMGTNSSEEIANSCLSHWLELGLVWKELEHYSNDKIYILKINVYSKLFHNVDSDSSEDILLFLDSIKHTMKRCLVGIKVIHDRNAAFVYLQTCLRHIYDKD